LSQLSVERLEIRDMLIGDERGYFVETYSQFAEIRIDAAFIQDNQSLSLLAGTVRAFQAPPAAQAKLMRVLSGSILDVVVDLRLGSPSYGRWCGTKLTAARGRAGPHPRGFAHGFCTLEADTEFAYKVDDYYAPECDAGILWNVELGCQSTGFA